MSKLTKDQYFRRELNAYRRNHENAELAQENGMSEEQRRAVIDLCALRHDFHKSIDNVARDDTDTRYKIRIVQLNARLASLDLPTIEGVPTIPEDYIDIDDLNERIEIAEFEGEMPDDENYNEWVDDQLNDITEQLCQVHAAMERCLFEVDKKYKTNFAPTGLQRL